MADVPNGGRIVPIVTPRQHYFNNSPDELQQLSQPQLPQFPPSRSSRNTRSKTWETESLEIPCLNELGLYALPTEGDGNCLYYALSDQLHGDFNHADEIRVRLADHIASHRDYFISFIAAVGGERRAPRRAAASAARYSYSSSSSASASPAPPSAKDKDRSFDSKVTEIRKNGVWGGAEELQAFCQSFKKDVRVYTMYGIQNFRDVHAPDYEEREIVHIAFHDFHHYSSVRHTNGPHTGLPCIPRGLEALSKDITSSGGTVVNMATPWKISAIQEGLGGRYDRDAIVEMLQQCRGNIDRAFNNLIGESTNSHLGEAPASKIIIKSRLQPSSRSSSPFSTASKRSADESDSEENPRPAVRRNRAHKRRMLPDVTVGIAFRDDKNDLVSLRLRVSPDTVGEETVAKHSVEHAKKSPIDEFQTDSSTGTDNDKEPQQPAFNESSGQPSEPHDEQKPRRSQRISRRRNASRAI